MPTAEHACADAFRFFCLDSRNLYGNHLTGRTAVSAFDIFLSHNSADKPAVEVIAYKLKDAGVFGLPGTVFRHAGGYCRMPIRRGGQCSTDSAS